MTRYIPINHREHIELKSIKIILNVWTVYTGASRVIFEEYVLSILEN